MALLIVSAVSSTVTAIVAVLVIFILNTLRKSKNQQQELLKLLESVQELTGQQNKETVGEIIKQSESYEVLKAQVDSLFPSIINLEHRLGDLLESNVVFQENTTNAILINNNTQLGRIQNSQKK
ncbi:MAG: hypothetical protein HC908_16285 [Calothrix sp. SM1_7_51]|nr:hypothetical protein [Calothrix sp. SM1_7_51]